MSRKLTRRTFLEQLGSATAVTLGAVGLPSLASALVPAADVVEMSPEGDHDRRQQAYQLRVDAALTVGGELNKLAANIALGRDVAGVHWRSDSIEGLKLGEAVAVGILRDLRATCPERFAGFSFTKFDGAPVTV